MTDLEIREGDKIIANFYGDISGITSYPDEPLEFHSSWDWLMPVVEKIKDTAGGLNSDGEPSEDKKAAFMLFGLSITTPIETVYLFVLKYIKWYNKINNKKNI